MLLVLTGTVDNWECQEFKVSFLEHTLDKALVSWKIIMDHVYTFHSYSYSKRIFDMHRDITLYDTVLTLKNLILGL